MDADFPAPDAPLLLNLLENGSDDVAGRGKPDPFVAAGLRKDQGINAYDLAISVDQGSAAISRVDGRICLDVNHRIAGPQLPSYRAHYTHRHGVLKPQGAAKREDELTGPQII